MPRLFCHAMHNGVLYRATFTGYGSLVENCLSHALYKATEFLIPCHEIRFAVHLRRSLLRARDRSRYALPPLLLSALSLRRLRALPPPTASPNVHLTDAEQHCVQTFLAAAASPLSLNASYAESKPFSSSPFLSNDAYQNRTASLQAPS